MGFPLSFTDLLPSTLFGFASLAVIVLLSWLGWAPLARWALRHIPGPPILPFLGHLPSILSKDLTFFLHEVAQKYGPVAQVWLGARPWVLVSDPILIRKIGFKALARPLSSGSFCHMLVGEPLEVDLESDIWNRGHAWRASRKAFESSIMHPEKLAGHVPALTNAIDRFLSYLQPYAASGEAIDMKKAFGMLSLATVGEVAYGVDFWPEATDTIVKHNGSGSSGPMPGTDDGPPDQQSTAAELAEACRECFQCFELKTGATGYLSLQLMLPALRPLWLWLAKHLPDAAQRRHMRARQKVADVSRRLMEQWQQQAAHKDASDGLSGAADSGNAKGGSGGFRELAGGISSSSFLAAMLGDRRAATGAAADGLPRMSDIQVISQGLTFMLAGYDTTSTSLAIATFLLADHTNVQDKLRQELSAHPGCLNDMDELSKLPYMEAVVRETGRLYPVATNVWRDLATDVDIGGGRVIPRNSFVCLGIYNVHRDPTQWPKPECFLPERFLPETKGLLGPTDPNAYIPFGVGPRMCVGYKLAMMTVKVTLAALILRYRVKLHPRQPLPLRLLTALVLAPADGVWISLSEL